MTNLLKWNPFKRARKPKEGDDARQHDARQHETKLPVRRMATTSPVGSPAPSGPFGSMLLDRFWHEPFAMLDELDRFFGNHVPASFQPPVDVADDGEHVEITAELPGLSPSDIELSAQEGALVLRGEKKAETKTDEGGWRRVERYFGRFSRTVPLPRELDLDRAEATFRNGVLKVRVPKLGGVERRRILVS